MGKGIALACVASLLTASCSFVAVHAPPSTYDPRNVSCTDSDVVPSIDSAVGVLAVAGAIGGEIVVDTTSHTVDNYELVLGLPLLVVGITYLVAASKGTGKVEACHQAKAGETTGCDGCPARVP